MPLFCENSGNDGNRIQGTQVGTREANGTSMYSTAMCGANGCYLEFSTGLKELAIISKSFADYGNRSAGIQKSPHSARCRKFETNSPTGLNNVF